MTRWHGGYLDHTKKAWDAISCGCNNFTNFSYWVSFFLLVFSFFSFIFSFIYFIIILICVPIQLSRQVWFSHNCSIRSLEPGKKNFHGQTDRQADNPTYRSSFPEFTVCFKSIWVVSNPKIVPSGCKAFKLSFAQLSPLLRVFFPNVHWGGGWVNNLPH